MGISAGCIIFLTTMSVIVYKCYRQRVMRNAKNRLSIAIKKGLQRSTTGSLRKSMPVRGSGIGPKVAMSKSMPVRGSGIGPKVAMSKSTSTITPTDANDASVKIFPITEFQSSVAFGGGNHSVVNVKTPTEVRMDNEKDGATPEKENGEVKRCNMIIPTDFGENTGCINKDLSKTTTKLGTLTFSVGYDDAKLTLVVTIICANELRARDTIEDRCHTYVKLQLLPEKKHKCKTRVVLKTRDPNYDETFTFYGVNSLQIPSISLHFIVLRFDRFSRDEIIGEVIYPIIETNYRKHDDIIIREITPRHFKVRPICF